MSCNVKNAPVALFPVKSWYDFLNIYRFLKDILDFGNSPQDQQYPREWDFVWVCLLAPIRIAVNGCLPEVVSDLITRRHPKLAFAAFVVFGNWLMINDHMTPEGHFL